MSCNTLCLCISSAWEQYFKILYNMHFDHVIRHHNTFCNIFVWKMSVCVCCDIIRLIWTWQQQKFNLMCFAKTCFSNHLVALFLFLRQYQPKKPHMVCDSDICKNKCANAKVPSWRFLMKITSFTAVDFRLCNIPELTCSLIFYSY